MGAGIVVLSALSSAACSDPPTLEERLVSSCEAAVRDNISSISFGGAVVDLKFSEMGAELWDQPDNGTDRWMVTGELVIETESTEPVSTNTWDSDGETSPETKVDPGKLQCRMGKRTSDDEIVAFDITHFHPTSGGSIGKQLVYEEGSGGESSDWGEETSTPPAPVVKTDYQRWADASTAVLGAEATLTMQAFEFQQSLCKELRSGGRPATGNFPAQSEAEYLYNSWAVGKSGPDADEERALIAEKVVIPTLCPEQAHWIADAKAKDFTPQQQTSFGNGKYIVGDKLMPGTYTIGEQVTDCYWERSDDQGNIIDNNFISIAPSVTVTIGEGDSGFTSEGCGTWKLVS